MNASNSALNVPNLDHRVDMVVVPLMLSLARALARISDGSRRFPRVEALAVSNLFEAEPLFIVGETYAEIADQKLRRD